MPFLSFIVGFRNRETERINSFLLSLESQTDKDFEVIFIDYGSSRSVAGAAEKIVRSYAFSEYHFFDTTGQHWNRGRCLNYGARKSKAQYLFTADIDFIFHPSFVAHCKIIASLQTPKYFTVAYLTEKQTRSSQAPWDHQCRDLSDPSAVGPLLISAEAFNSVSGYDEFYEIWGLEDNDLKLRLEQSGKPLKFISGEVLIWHAWHPPVKTTGLLPRGWLTFLTDYFKRNRDRTETFISHLDPDRPVLSARRSAPDHELKVNCGEVYFQYELHNLFARMAKGEILAISFDLSAVKDVERSGLNRFVDTLNSFFSGRKWPLLISNIHMNSYLQERTARDVLIYFIKFNLRNIRDYYIPEDISKESAYIMKR